ncbi:MAG TPA: SRPBCC family protein [Terriglobales bacterium]|nr:SRPBCC family protein [Terriglobales bacterium]
MASFNQIDFDEMDFSNDYSSAEDSWMPQNWQTWAVLAGSGVLLGYGLTRRNRAGLASSVAGAALLYRGIAMTRDPEAGLFPQSSTNVDIQKTVSIQRPKQELLDYWSNPENLKNFMVDVESVTAIGPNRQHWVMKFPVGPRLEWDSEVLVSGDQISWQTEKGAPFDNMGTIGFQEGTHPGETHVRMETYYRIPGGILTRGLAMLAGRDPEQMVRENLRRFKQLMEAGEIATTARQPSGRTPLRNKLTESLYHENMGTTTKRTA